MVIFCLLGMRGTKGGREAGKIEVGSWGGTGSLIHSQPCLPVSPKPNRCFADGRANACETAATQAKTMLRTGQP